MSQNDVPYGLQQIVEPPVARRSFDDRREWPQALEEGSDPFDIPTFEAAGLSGSSPLILCRNDQETPV
jgi:hypothetical protein